MMEKFNRNNLFKSSLSRFQSEDPQLTALRKLKYQHHSDWWQALDLKQPGIYILTGGRQIGKSTSCKLLIEHCLIKQHHQPDAIFYCACDEIFDAKELSQTLRHFLEDAPSPFLLIIDEITFVPHWDRVIKSLADEGYFTKGVCLLTGSDSVILKEAAMSFPGRRGMADVTDFHLYPLSFKAYVDLVNESAPITPERLQSLYLDFLKCGGYLRAINDLAQYGEIKKATYQTYEQWIRGDFLKKDKQETYLLAILQTLFETAGSQVSYSALTQKTGLMSKETFITYCHLLERMDVIFPLKAFDQNKKRGFPKKAMKYHFLDPFIANTIYRWLQNEGMIGTIDYTSELVEASVASMCQRYYPSFYYKAAGEVDVIYLEQQQVHALEVKWSNQVRPNDLKTLLHFKNKTILKKHPTPGLLENTDTIAVYDFLFHHFSRRF